MLTLLLLALLSNGDEWAQLPAVAAPGAVKSPDLSPRARYETATRYLAGGKPADASAILDLLIAELPRVPEYFAACASVPSAGPRVPNGLEWAAGVWLQLPHGQRRGDGLRRHT